MPTRLHRWAASDIHSWEECDGALLSPVVALPPGCLEIVPSWGAETPGASAIELRLSLLAGGEWTDEYRMARWGGAAGRTSFDEHGDAVAAVSTDTLRLRAPAEAVRARVLLRKVQGAAPTLTSLTLACSSAHDGALSPPSASAVELATPQYAQYAIAGGRWWCSPSCMAMLLGYWHGQTGWAGLAPFAQTESVPELAAPGVYDPCYDGCGNWSFNVAFAAEHGLEAYVTRLDTLDQARRWVACGVPLVLSVAWEEGELPGAGLRRSSGHLLIARGFTADGDVIAADPAAQQHAEVRRVYPWRAFASCWIDACGGTAYIVYPPGWRTPAPGPGDGWAP
jgi:hypothetical protein